MMRRALTVALLAAALGGCGAQAKQPPVAVQERQCWGQDSRADGTREGPWACMPDGVTPDLSAPRW